MTVQDNNLRLMTGFRMSIGWQATHSDCDGADLEGGHCVTFWLNETAITDWQHHDAVIDAHNRAKEIWNEFAKALNLPTM